jgi:hypothetical protein
MTFPFTSDNYRIILEKKGDFNYTRMSYPVHCGVFSEIAAKDFVLHFNLNGEIIRAKGQGQTWGHPHEWLKRTAGNDWVYYSTGGYAGVFEATGEYYLPNFAYETNNLLGGAPFTQQEVVDLVASWHLKLTHLTEKISNPPPAISHFLSKSLANSPTTLEEKAQQLSAIVGGRISVLPPDARHVDYNIIPLTIAAGCLYKCRFCKVKNAHPFCVKTKEEISNQISRLKNLYAADLANYNALFLGEHDALQAGADTICFSIQEAYRGFGFADSHIEGCKTFLFGSATSLLDAPEHLFIDLEQMPGMTYINIGLEAVDQETLDKLGKPLSAALVQKAFDKMQDVNNRYATIEITANFVLDEHLPENHYPAILQLIRDRLIHSKPKGSVYFSPLTFNQPSRARLFAFNRLKVLSRLPTFLYTIQRL